MIYDEWTHLNALWPFYGDSCFTFTVSWLTTADKCDLNSLICVLRNYWLDLILNSWEEQSYSASLYSIWEPKEIWEIWSCDYQCNLLPS